MSIRNPILPGFNPDPSIIRVGEDYYIATSTFEWWPGVRIHHSRDLVNWHLLGHALTRRSQLDMRGNPASGGIWAPGLSWHDGVFHLVYTDVKNCGAGFVDAHNYLVTTTDIHDPDSWSERIALNSHGFDPSLFHDADGRKWLVNMSWDHRRSNKSAGILLQEYDPGARTLVGPSKMIFRGTAFECVEAPHLYFRNGWYYLMTAEGGTEYGHVVTLARSRAVDGPYEVCPHNPILTARDDASLPLQKAGHASLVETTNGRWYMAYLCGRPLPEIDGQRLCNLGRETALIECRFNEDDWLELVSGGNHSELVVDAPGLEPMPFEALPARDTFDGTPLNPEFNTLREPIEASWCSLTERPGWLRLHGRESPGSRFDVSLLARRLTSQSATATTRMDFTPTCEHHLAGLICWYNERNFYLFRVGYDNEQGPFIGVFAVEQGAYRETKPIPFPADPSIADPSIEARSVNKSANQSANQPIELQARFDGPTITFSYRLDEPTATWHTIPETFNAGTLSDDACNGFTGTYVGMSAHDLTGANHPADFEWFEYRP